MNELTAERLQAMGFNDSEIAGIQCFFDDNIPANPNDDDFMSGWVIGWGLRDKLQGQQPVLPTDPDYFRGYRAIEFVIKVVV